MMIMGSVGLEQQQSHDHRQAGGRAVLTSPVFRRRPVPVEG
jgi:hypothetical protein